MSLWSKWEHLWRLINFSMVLFFDTIFYRQFKRTWVEKLSCLSVPQFLHALRDIHTLQAISVRAEIGCLAAAWGRGGLKQRKTPRAGHGARRHDPEPAASPGGGGRCPRCWRAAGAGGRGAVRGAEGTPARAGSGPRRSPGCACVAGVLDSFLRAFPRDRSSLSRLGSSGGHQHSLLPRWKGTQPWVR